MLRNHTDLIPNIGSMRVLDGFHHSSTSAYFNKKGWQKNPTRHTLLNW